MNEEDKEFVASVVYFYKYKGDPTRSMDWDLERCKELMPDFYYHWNVFSATKKAMDLIIEDHSDKLDE